MIRILFYIAQSEMEEVQKSMKGSFVGIGINYNLFNDTLAIIKAIPGGPSYKAGLRAGDRILFADNHKIFGNNLTNDSLVNILKGKMDSTVKLKVYRKKDGKFLNVDVKRGEIPLKSVDVAIKINDTLGYIKIIVFQRQRIRSLKQDWINYRLRE
ncbi:S41 family peptidase [Paenimyroides ceti]|uniref:S41 family peptidase n=1 Tax=Paenimyroides ceti TaxID=395087 RepID=UPI00294FF24B|nr:PDZ domain-containing protein [Paenimyroides ceti]